MSARTRGETKTTIRLSKFCLNFHIPPAFILSVACRACLTGDRRFLRLMKKIVEIKSTPIEVFYIELL